MKPNYLVIGASKAGTSSLCNLLGQHPDVFMSQPKEPNFFCYDHVYSSGWGWYKSLFEEGRDCRAVGEGTTQYSQHTVFPQCVNRIAKHLPEAKLIYIVRHPMDRMESLWTQLLEHQVSIPFEFKKALRKALPRFIDSSNYLREIDRFREHYADEAILILFFEDFKANPYQVLSECYRFLGVSDAFRPGGAELPQNVSAHKTVESPVLKSWRRIPGRQIVRQFVPGRVKRALKSRLRVPAPDRPTWDEPTRRWVIDQLGSDTVSFLMRYGKPPTFWELENWARDRQQSGKRQAHESRHLDIPGANLP